MIRAHGTPNRYEQGCRCTACIVAKAGEDEEKRAHRARSASKGRTRGVAPSRVHFDRLRSGQLAVECWCRQAVVYVEPAVIAATLTESCGRPDCHKPLGGNAA